MNESTIGSTYERALRGGLRFPSSKGPRTLEDLWQVPLRSKDDFNLDAIAQAIDKTLEGAARRSFVDTDSTSNPERAKAQLALDIVTHVIEVKKAEEDQLRKRAANAETKKTIMAIIADKQNTALAGKSVEELTKMLESLG